MKIGSPKVRMKEDREFPRHVHKKPTDWLTLGLAFIISAMISAAVIYEFVDMIKGIMS